MNKIKTYALSAVVFIILIIIGGLILYSFVEDNSGCNVEVIELQGELSTFKESADDFTVLSFDIVSQIEDADNNEDIKAIILSIDSAGGYAVAGEEVANALIRAQKPTVSLIRVYGASAAYLAASGADKIFASKYSDVGSIAVTQSYSDNAIYNEKEGYTFNQLTSGKFKNTGSPDKPLTQDERNILMRDINIMHADFVKDIAANRNLDISKVQQLADGSSMLGQMARDNGLIDEIGGMADVIAYIEGIINETPVICLQTSNNE